MVGVEILNEVTFQQRQRSAANLLAVVLLLAAVKRIKWIHQRPSSFYSVQYDAKREGETIM